MIANLIFERFNGTGSWNLPLNKRGQPLGFVNFVDYAEDPNGLDAEGHRPNAKYILFRTP